ncbi:hypothetical protein EVAR_20614_1 [Eumeta japonica]|uniref:Uncharacterized protein n=1 Tax=Eumeta variegata TaxID=151549 RepID=A0A4C1US10_EUMVA|nr:hypothetical protein EVAR_20614_1 [Eumeta japonica]
MNSFFMKTYHRKWIWISPDAPTDNEVNFIMTTKRQLFDDFAVINKNMVKPTDLSTQLEDCKREPHSYARNARENLKVAGARRGRRGAGAFERGVSEKKDRSVLISKLGFAQIRIDRREEAAVFDLAAASPAL